MEKLPLPLEMDTQLEFLNLVSGQQIAGDSLDTFMNSVGTSMDKSTRMKLKRKVFELKKVGPFDIRFSSPQVES